MARERSSVICWKQRHSGGSLTLGSRKERCRQGAKLSEKPYCERGSSACMTSSAEGGGGSCSCMCAPSPVLISCLFLRRTCNQHPAKEGQQNENA